MPVGHGLDIAEEELSLVPPATQRNAVCVVITGALRMQRVSNYMLYVILVSHACPYYFVLYVQRRERGGPVGGWVRGADPTSHRAACRLPARPYHRGPGLTGPYQKRVFTFTCFVNLKIGTGMACSIKTCFFFIFRTHASTKINSTTMISVLVLDFANVCIC